MNRSEKAYQFTQRVNKQKGITPQEYQEMLDFFVGAALKYFVDFVDGINMSLYDDVLQSPEFKEFGKKVLAKRGEQACRICNVKWGPPPPFNQEFISNFHTRSMSW